MQLLRELKVSPASIMDPHRHGDIPETAKPIIHEMFSSGLTWVFLAMAGFAICQLAVSYFMATADDFPAAGEADPLEALPG